jgi:CheY-like chemotaxis protein
MKKNPPEVLLVEDDNDTAELIVDTARVCRSALRWERCSDGEQALARMRSFGEERPGVVLLDLHLPRLDGLDVLRAMKADPSLRSLPVVVMSSSREEADIEAVYSLGANCYVAKPGSFEGLCGLVRFLEAFLTLPRSAEPAAPVVEEVRTLN